jgi:hypothetical protein
VRIVLSLAWVLVAAAGCYQQPEIPRDRPLACASSDEGECPAGFVCVAGRVCAPRQCAADPDCPVGLVCSRSACGLPGTAAGDGGVVAADAGAPDGAEADRADALADAGGGS